MKEHLPISSWAAEDIPSCKMKNDGVKSLSTVELLSIIIGSGSSNENAVELSRRLLLGCENSLKKLCRMTHEEITSLNGFGDCKASKVLAALELGNRMSEERASERADLGTATRVYNYMAPRIADLDTEEFWVLFLNHNFKLIKAKRISLGGLTETAVDVRIVIREAVLCNATILVACHNHPSGSIRPSRYDDQLTETIRKACEVMRLYFQDHVIVTDGDYYSYHENGKLLFTNN